MLAQQQILMWGYCPIHSPNIARSHRFKPRRASETFPKALHQSDCAQSSFKRAPVGLPNPTSRSKDHNSFQKGIDFLEGFGKDLVVGMFVGMQFLMISWLMPQDALALLNAPRALLPRTAEAALRRSIPTFNTDVGQIQSYMEDIQFSLRIPQRKPWATIQKNVKSAEELVADVPRMLIGVPKDKVGDAELLVADIAKGLFRVESAVGARDQEKTGQRVADTLKSVADLELLQAPGLSFIIPRDYATFPRLTGRATAEFTIKKGDGSTPFYNNKQGTASDVTTLRIVLDGYSAPISAGNFAANIANGLYNGKQILADRNAVAGGAGLAPNKSIPLEILPVGDFDPLYGIPIDVQSGERPVLPLSINGAVSMARSKNQDYALASDEFFIYKFNRAQAGLAGMSFDEGRFGVFGYVVGGLDAIESLTSGDTIVAAKLISGSERLTDPKTAGGK
ncbi:hypothetical protein BSKO_09833 [Bryopsis sp. KO-2023]|nr:hypothetical protein BSKO_09833 [Bryopsis sp. KO-2023]